MKERRLRRISTWAGAPAILLSLLLPASAHSQESPDTLTRAEWSCQRTTARVASASFSRNLACLDECKEDPSRSCEFFADEAATQCMERARGRSQIQLLRSCTATDCPECYGTCQFFHSSLLTNVAFEALGTLRVLACDDAASPDGQNATERRCQVRQNAAAVKLVEQARRCADKCQARVQRGQLTAEACRFESRDGGGADPRFQSCIDKARTRFLRTCLKCRDATAWFR